MTKGRRAGAISTREVEVPLRDAMRGAKMRIALNAEDGCANCGGTGVVAREERRGKMRVVRAAEPCPVCHGRGTIPARRSLEVTIPPGMVDGTRMRLKGQGGKGPRPELNGDLFLTVRLKTDRVFSVAGRDSAMRVAGVGLRGGAGRGDHRADARRADLAENSRRAARPGA